MKIKDITCNSPIEAEGFRSALREAGIQSNIFDETNSKVARGILDKRTDVLVREEDYEQAMKIYESYMAGQQAVMPWCPKCGSEDVSVQKKKNATTRQMPRILASLLMFIPIGVCTTESLSATVADTSGSVKSITKSEKGERKVKKCEFFFPHS